MTAIAAQKPSMQNRLEGFALTALFQGLPTFAASLLLLKLVGPREIASGPYGPVILVAMTSLLYGLLMPFLAACFQRVRDGAYEPLFYDATLSFTDKIAQWCVQPKTSQQLLTTLIMLSVLAVIVVSVR